MHLPARKASQNRIIDGHSSLGEHKINKSVLINGESLTYIVWMRRVQIMIYSALVLKLRFQV